MQNTKRETRAANLVVLILFVFIHYIFVGRVLFQNSKSLLAYVVSFLILALLIPGYSYAIPKTSHLARPIRLRNMDGKARFQLSSTDWFSILGCTLAAISTHFLCINIDLGPVLAASLIGLLSSMIPMIHKESHSYKAFPFCAYCGAFVGMSASFIMDSIWYIALAGLLAGMIYVTSMNILKGIGGRLGTFAFISVFIVYFAFNLRIDSVQFPQAYDRNLLHIIIILATSFLGSSVSFFICNYYNLSKVKSSALPSFIIGLLFYIFPNILSPDLSKLIPMVFMGASFNGMTTNRIISHSQIALSGILFGIIFIFIHKHFNGFGGVIGTAACISIISTLGIHNLQYKLKKYLKA